MQKNAKACGSITYVARGRSREDATIGPLVLACLHVYDIELLENIVPSPHDNEIEEFYLWNVERVKTALFNQEFKTNCAAVMIDFFIRHGHYHRRERSPLS